MILHGVGPCLITRLLRAEREGEIESDWLLHGPTDPQVVEADAPGEAARLLAAE